MVLRRSAPALLAAVVLLLSGCLQGVGPAGRAGNHVESSRTNLAAQLAAGKAYLAAEQPNDAYVVFRRATLLDKSSYDGQLGLAQACAKLGCTNAGLNAAEAAAKLQPKQAAPLLAAGQIALGAQRPGEAEKYFREALALDPKLADAWTGLGDVRLIRRSIGESISALERARDLAPQKPENHARLAAVYAAAGESVGAGDRWFAAAIAEYRTAAKLDPKNSNYPRNLAWLIIQQGGDLNEARACAKKSDDLERGDGDALVASAVALLRQGNAEDAVNELRSGLAKMDSNGDMWIYFAEASAQRGKPGDYENAVRALENVQALQLPHRRVTQEQVQRLVERIKSGLTRERERIGTK